MEPSLVEPSHLSIIGRCKNIIVTGSEGSGKSKAARALVDEWKMNCAPGGGDVVYASDHWSLQRLYEHLSAEYQEDAAPRHNCLVMDDVDYDSKNYPLALERLFEDSAKFLLTIILICENALLLPRCIFKNTHKILLMKPDMSSLDIMSHYRGSFMEPDSNTVGVSTRMSSFLQCGAPSVGSFAVLTTSYRQPFSNLKETWCSISFGRIEMTNAILETYVA